MVKRFALPLIAGALLCCVHAVVDYLAAAFPEKAAPPAVLIPGAVDVAITASPWCA
jgi:hypothetical protein